MGLFKNKSVHGNYERNVIRTTGREDFRGVIEFLKSNPYDSSSSDIVFLYENASNYEQKNFIEKIVKNYIIVEIDFEKIEIYDGDDWFYERGKTFSTRYQKYDIPVSTKEKLNQARRRLEMTKINEKKQTENEKLKQQKQLEDKFDELF